MSFASIDFETRATIDLRKTGVYPYALHKHTSLWCMAWAIDDMEPELWVPGERFPSRLMGFIMDTDGELRAWNANFERIMWRDCANRLYDSFPVLPKERWVDTAAEAAVLALPRHLENCARVMGIQEQKDSTGHRLMMQMCKPRSRHGDVIVWWDDEPRRQRLYEYCKQDVIVERSIARRMQPLVAREQQVYALDQTINDRGVLVDVPLVKAMQKLAVHGIDIANAEIAKISEGHVSAVTNTAEIREFVGVESVKKSAVRDLLLDEDSQLTNPQREVLELRADFGRSSVAKLASILRARCPDDRIRGMMLYHGANTGRWAGKLVQPHNFPRPDVEAIEGFIPHVLAQEYDLIDTMAPPLAVIASMLRSTLRAKEGHRFLVGDFAQIEARIVNWIAGQVDIAELFRANAKVYEKMAGLLYSVDPDDIEKGSQQRTVGKTVELACGFGMGAEKFQKTMIEWEGIDLGEDVSELAVKAYRATHPQVVKFWYDIEAAAMKAVRNAGKTYEVRSIRFIQMGQYLYLLLPSKRALAYAAPVIEDRERKRKVKKRDGSVEIRREIRPALVAWSVDGYTKKWKKRALYGGLLVENIVQALARDVMADAMITLEALEFYPLILSVHDEIVSETAIGHGSLDEFLAVMRTPPAWDPGMPVEAEGWEGERYRK